MKPGTRDSQNRLWIRCEECGDSKNPYNCHKIIDQQGSTYCFRCGHSTQLSMEALMALALGEISVEEALEDEWKEVERNNSGQVTERFTWLDAWETEDMDDYYSFPMRSSNGETVGWHNRHKTNKTFINEGKRGLGFVGTHLISSPDRPLIVVEGPYDVIEPHYVCVFGTLNKTSLKQLRLQYFWLFPDPDMVDTIDKRNKLEQTIKELQDEHCCFIYGYILGNDDPDKATKKVYIHTVGA